MRFEIGPGGTIVILLGLAGLSGAVFGLGLVAGHELASQEQPTQQTASAIALPPAPAMPAAAMSPSAPAANAPLADSASAPAADSAPPVSPDAAVMPPAGMPVSETGAAASPPLHSSAAGPALDHLHKTLASLRERTAGLGRPKNSAEDSIPVAPDAGEAMPPPPVDYVAPAPHETIQHPLKRAALVPHKKMALNTQPKLAPATHPEPYSVQIDAVMDRQGAEQMAAKLRAHGFQPFVVQTELEGQVWYRVRVGRYATPQEAKAAEIRLHQEFGNSPLGR